jgi:hypothetical protein
VLLAYELLDERRVHLDLGAGPSHSNRH